MCLPPFESIFHTDDESEEDDVRTTLLFDAKTAPIPHNKRAISMSAKYPIPIPTTPISPVKQPVRRPQSDPAPISIATISNALTAQPSLVKELPKGKKLRLFISASGLRWPVKLSNGTGPGGVNRHKLIYAKIYLQEGPRLDTAHHFSACSAVSAITAVTEGTTTYTGTATAPVSGTATAITGTTMSYDRYHHAQAQIRSSDSSRSDDYDNDTVTVPRSHSEIPEKYSKGRKKPAASKGKKGKLLGYTEKAQICGRDVEFVKHFNFTYNKSTSPVINAEIYGLPNATRTTMSMNSSEPNLIGTASFPLEDLYENENCGKQFPVTLLPPPPPIPEEPETKRAAKRRQRKAAANVGCINVAVEHLPKGRKPPKYFVDIQCASMQRSRPWGKTRVKNAYYTIHGVGRDDVPHIHDNNTEKEQEGSEEHIDMDIETDVGTGADDTSTSTGKQKSKDGHRKRKNKRDSKRKARKGKQKKNGGNGDSEELEETPWVLLFRSKKVGLVKKKKDGGSMEYNYFSSRPLLATPGELFKSSDDEDSTRAAAAGTEGNALLARVRREVEDARRRHEGQFFSMPSGIFTQVSSARPLKLSIMEAGESLADTEFSVDTLRNMALGDKLDMVERKKGRVVGHSMLKFVEKADQPAYFCLSVSLPELAKENKEKDKEKKT